MLSDNLSNSTKRFLYVGRFLAGPFSEVRTTSPATFAALRHFAANFSRMHSFGGSLVGYSANQADTTCVPRHQYDSGIAELVHQPISQSAKHLAIECRHLPSHERDALHDDRGINELLQIHSGAGSAGRLAKAGCFW